MRAQDKFGEVIEFDKYRLWDASHPLRFLGGLDEKGRKTLVLLSPSKPDKVRKTSAIDVDLDKISDSQYKLAFHLNDSSMDGIFLKFCDDLVESTRVINDEAIGMTFVCKRYNSWKKLFYKLNKTTLSDSQQMGLIGELLFLKEDLFKQYDYMEAINAWSGCDKTHKDFSINDDWYEIKSSAINSLTIKISSIEQLDSDNDGTLVVYEFEKMSGEYNGLTLNTVVNDLLSMLSDEEEDLMIEKLKAAGWEMCDEYDKTCFRPVSKNYYLVNNDFPKISKNDLKISIMEVQYQILKRDLNDFLIRK